MADCRRMDVRERRNKAAPGAKQDEDRRDFCFYQLTFPGEESGQKLAQAVPGVSAILDLVVVGELP